MARAVAALALALAALVLVLIPTATAAYEDEQALAKRHAPVVRLVEQAQECGYGEPFVPTDIDRLLGADTVSLRGPWNSTDLVKIGPTPEDLVGRFEYHLDYPGDPLDAGCDYERWVKHLDLARDPVVYAHVVTEPEKPGKVSLQYWLFYPFNDFNNTHEGDWEMVQLNFDAADAADALGKTPSEVGYSAHEGATRSAWEDDKLEVVDETHPVIYPAAGSHANKYSAALWLGSSAEAGVGCDDTRAPHTELRPRVETIPSDPVAARTAYPWIAFEGRWGELQKAFFNGPTGPNQKGQWTQPITWSEGWHDRSYAVPTGGVFGTNTTDFFCSAVARGSSWLIRLLRNPVPMLLAIGTVVGLALLLAYKARWTPTATLRVGRRRSWGQIMSASGRMYVERPRLLLGLGVLLIPLSFVITAVQWLLIEGIDLLGVVTGEAAGSWAYLAAVFGTTLTVLGLGFVQAAIASAIVEIDRDTYVGPVHAYRLAFRCLRPLAGAILIAVAVALLLTTSVFLVPIAAWLVIRWALAAPVVAVEGIGSIAALRRSGELVRGRWFRVTSLVGVSAAIALVTGPLLGAILIFLTNLPLGTLNIVAGVVYALAMPFVGLVTAYTYFDCRTRFELEPAEDVSELAAEISLERA